MRAPSTPSTALGAAPHTTTSGCLHPPLGRQLSTDPNNGMELVLQRVNASDPIRNIRAYLPGYETVGPYAPFHPFLLNYISSFRVLR